MTLKDYLLGLVPVTILHGALEVSPMMAVQVCEDAVLVTEPSMLTLRGHVLDGSQTPCLL